MTVNQRAQKQELLSAALAAAPRVSKSKELVTLCQSMAVDWNSSECCLITQTDSHMKTSSSFPFSTSYRLVSFISSCQQIPTINQSYISLQNHILKARFSAKESHCYSKKKQKTPNYLHLVTHFFASKNLLVYFQVSSLKTFLFIHS